MTYYIQTKRVKGKLAFRVSYDSDIQNPRKDALPMTTVVSWSKKYSFSDTDEFKTPEDFLETVRESDTLRPLYMYDHGGISLSMGGFSCPWDSGQVGFVLATPEQVHAEGLDPNDTEAVERRMKSDVEELSQYINGEVYAVSVHEIYKEQILPEPEACFGFIWSLDDKCLDDCAEELLREVEDELTRGITAGDIASADWRDGSR